MTEKCDSIHEGNRWQRWTAKEVKGMDSNCHKTLKLLPITAGNTVPPYRVQSLCENNKNIETFSSLMNNFVIYIHIC